MVITWLRFALRQLATALVVVTSILLLSEILLPASILPYFNLHILIFVTLAIAVTSPMIDEKSRVTRYALCVMLGALLLAYAWIVFGMSTSGLALFVALAILLIGVIVALTTLPPPLTPPHLEEGKARGGGSQAAGTPAAAGRPPAPLKGGVVVETVEVEIVEEELDIFMR